MANQFEFIRGGRKLWISLQDVTAKRLSTAFQVDEDSLYLKQEWGDSAVFPDDGKFNLLPYTVGTSFEVMGVEKSKQNPPSSALSYTSASTSSQSGANNYSNNQQTSRLFAAFKKSTDKTSFACKIVLADKTGKGFTEKNQMYLTLREDSANVPFVLDKAKEKFGKELILVSGNGLPIEDEEGTRGKDNNCYAGFFSILSRVLFTTYFENEKKKNTHS
ncbi:hypothetical protein AC249_AIPGENE754 [Exaiptasia diaphana]|nr:hypothetical protein AC249_AIPGENE754 [Exaiptasia diaphana]